MSAHSSSLLGWKVSEHKLLDFNTICKVLGVDLGQSGFVTNTVERVEELVAEIDEASKSNLLPRRDGEKLRGRLQFRKFSDVWKALQKTAEGPFEPCHGWQADFV